MKPPSSINASYGLNYLALDLQADQAGVTKHLNWRHEYDAACLEEILIVRRMAELDRVNDQDGVCAPDGYPPGCTLHFQ